MPSRHGSVQSLNSPPTHPLLYTMSDVDLPPTQHPSLANMTMNTYDLYDAPPPTGTSVGESSSGMGSVRPKRKQVKNACSACQRACKRCDVGRPCERCIKYGMAESCRDSQRKERKKGIKRGPYKKRDGMINDLQRMSPKRMARVPSVGEVDLSAANLIPIDVDPVPTQTQVQTTPLQMHSVPSVRPADSQYTYQTPVMIPASHNTAQTPPLSLAGIHQHQQHPQSQYQHQQHHANSNPHPQASSSYHHSEEQYYSTRYDHLQHAPARSAHFRTDESCSQPSHHQDYSRHVPTAQDYTRSPMTGLQYPSPEHSPPRERQYSNAVYHDNSSRHSMVQAVHHDPSYQSQSDSMAHDHESHDTRVMDQYYATQPQQHHPQRQYSSEGHMPDVHQQQDRQQQQQSYYSNYNAYQQPPTSYGSPHSHSQQQHQQQYGYSQNHVSQQQAMSQSQADAGYSQLNYASTGSSSMNAYPAQPQHQMDNAGVPLQYPSMRSPTKMVHRGSFDATAGMVAHPHHHSHHPQHHHQHHSQHVGNVQIQSN